MPDSRQRLQALESGAADVIQQLAPDDLPLVRLNPDLGLAMAPATLVSYLAMNTQRRPLNDLRIRRAIAHAVNRDALVKLVYQGLGHPGDRPAAAQRVGRALRRRHLSRTIRPARASCWRRRAGRAIARRR